MCSKPILVKENLIIFDGVCNFCNGAVNFIIRRDPNALFRFSPMQTAYAQGVLSQYGIANLDSETLVLLKGGECFVYSDAALEIAKDLRGLWRYLYVLKFFPRALRNFFYRLIARNRYRFFGKQQQCMIPSKELLGRFVGID